MTARPGAADDAPPILTSTSGQKDLPRWFEAAYSVLRGLESGSIDIALPDGRVFRVSGGVPGPAARIDIRDPRLFARIAREGELGFCEAYLDGWWDSPDLQTFLDVLLTSTQWVNRSFPGARALRLWHQFNHWLNRNTRRQARRNIAAHYDLGNAFYSRWLDETMTYSSARFTRAGMALDAAQREKYAALARLMDLRSGQSVLEIGCGWGGFAEFAAKEIGARVTAVTISREQFDFARQRMFNAGLAERADIQLIDYRDVEGRFDRVASIEMFEAVGQEYWPAYFSKIRDVLEPGGRAGLQIITIEDALFDDYNRRTDFIQKYIFPGGMLPSEERLKPVIDRAGLTWREVERFGQDYADTLKLWDERFQSAWGDIRRMGGFDERFRRLWRFYLAYCEAGFRSARTDVIQLALTRP